MQKPLSSALFIADFSKAMYIFFLHYSKNSYHNSFFKSLLLT